MQRSEIVLATMAASDQRVQLDPVQAQKIFFLVDREIPELVGGPHFDFKPYHYGPFDKAVYDELDGLAMENEVLIVHTSPYRRYLLTDSGYAKGEEVLDNLPEVATRYLAAVTRWVHSLTFKQLLFAIYEHYPDMATNSIISRFVSDDPRASFLFPMPSFVTGMARTFDFMGTIDEYQSDMGDDHIDTLAMYNDWRAIGDDLEAAMERTRSSGYTP